MSEALFQLEPWRVQERRRFLRCQKPSRKSERIASAELSIKRLRKTFSRKMLPKARRKLIYEKLRLSQAQRRMSRTEIRMAGMARKAGNFCVPTEPRLAFVFRTRGVSGVSPEVRKVLQLLGLLQIFSGTLLSSTRLP